MGVPETGHLAHAGASRDYQEALTVFHLTAGESSYSPYYLEQHEEYNQVQSTHNTHVEASYLPTQSQVQLPSTK